jgi:hypothetical protein
MPTGSGEPGRCAPYGSRWTGAEASPPSVTSRMALPAGSARAVCQVPALLVARRRVARQVLPRAVGQDRRVWGRDKVEVEVRGRAAGRLRPAVARAVERVAQGGGAAVDDLGEPAERVVGERAAAVDPRQRSAEHDRQCDEERDAAAERGHGRAGLIHMVTLDAATSDHRGRDACCQSAGHLPHRDDDSGGAVDHEHDIASSGACARSDRVLSAPATDRDWLLPRLSFALDVCLGNFQGTLWSD